MIDTANKRRAAMSTIFRVLILPTSNGTSEVGDRGILAGVYAFLSAAPVVVSSPAPRAFVYPARNKPRKKCKCNHHPCECDFKDDYIYLEEHKQPRPGRRSPWKF